MARKNTDTGAGTDPLDGADQASPAGSTIPAADAQPMRGGSYMRNDDGSLTQTEGHGFIADHDKE